MTANRLITLASLALCAPPLLGGEPFSIHWRRTRPCCLDAIPTSNYQYTGRSPSVIVVSKTGVLLRKSTSVIDEVLAQAPPSLAREAHREEKLETVRKNLETEELNIQRRESDTLELTGPEGSMRDEQSSERFEVLPTPAPSAPLRVDGRIVNSKVQTRFAPAVAVTQKTVIDLYQLDQAGLAIQQCAISQVALQLHDSGKWVLSLRADQNRAALPGAPAAFNPFAHIKRNQFVVRLRCLGAFQNPPTSAEVANGKPVLVELDPGPFWVENGQPKFIATGDYNQLVREHFADIDRVEIEFYFR